MKTANLIEIFSSIQGEGPYLGDPMVFVRFQDCALSCNFCDTPESFKKFSQFRLEEPPGSGRFSLRENPVSSDSLKQILFPFNQESLSLTGGEPLQQVGFLQEFLPQIQNQFRIFLETNGVLPKELEKVIEFIDVVSMDIKLPSVTGMRGYWKEHEAFLKIALKKEVYVKVVLSAPTEPAELLRAVSMVRRFSPNVPFILQPVTPYGSVQEKVREDQLRSFFQISKQSLPDVRIIPQIHPRLGVL